MTPHVERHVNQKCDEVAELNKWEPFGQVMRSDNIKQQRGKRNHPDEQNKPKLPLGIHLDVDAPL
jgi:hypothetical protein